MAKTNWLDTKLFLELVKRNDTALDTIGFLKNPIVMKQIENILDKGNTTPRNFTLHDSAHSFRVAERMWTNPSQTMENLSNFELCFLLLSAYLHDIGMSPDFEKVENHLNFITGKDKKALNSADVQEFQKWIDDDEKTKSIDIRNESFYETGEIDRILTYYIRYKHNDWSGEFINNNFADELLEGYPNWKDDLILLCKSHHYGLERLKKSDFDPKFAGNSTIHLRYLAMCLRVADVMENDPERTPSVILNHRKVSDLSRKYWIKDHYFTLIKNEDNFSIHSRPKEAFIHKAVEETAKFIEEELRLCNQLKTDKGLNHSPVRPLENYNWTIDPTLVVDIKPHDNSYEYIQGAFRPNTAKLLEILGGNQIYGNPIWAIRELLQNAFDAVKEKIAYQIINEDKEPSIWLRKLGELNEIEVKILLKDDGYWLVCKDSGVGMTKNIIINYFLESGSSKRHEIRELERKAKAKGFNFTRTGQFGIGVLSYFMIAERIIIYTKRAQNTEYNDDELIGWLFEINGLHDFGELKRLQKPIFGTEIHLKLNEQISSNIEKWSLELIDFLRMNVRNSPCQIKIVVNTTVADREVIIPQEWADTSLEIKSMVGEKFIREIRGREIEDEDKILSLENQELRLKNSLLANSALAELKNIMEILFDEGTLPNNIGKYRIHIPYFKLNKGNSFYYLKEEVTSKTHKLLKISDGFYFIPKYETIDYSLKGFKIDLISSDDRFGRNRYKSPAVENAYIEIDIENIDETSLSVSRHHLLVNKDFTAIKKFMDDRALELIARNANLFEGVYSTLNNFVYNIFPTQYYWAKYPNNKLSSFENFLIWQPISFPCTQDFADFPLVEEWKINEKVLSVLPLIYAIGEHTNLDWFDHNINYCKLGIYQYSGENDFLDALLKPVCRFITEQELQLSNDSGSPLKFINAPACIDNLIGYFARDYTYYEEEFYLNTNYKLFGLLNYTLLTQLRRTNIKDIDESKIKSKEEMFTFLVYSIMAFAGNQWLPLCEQKEKLVKRIFQELKIKSIEILADETLLEIKFKHWKEVGWRNFVRGILQNSSKDYILKAIPVKQKKNR